MVDQPITAARETPPAGGLAAAVGLGVIVPTSDPLDPDNKWRQGYVLEGEPCGAVSRLGDECGDEATLPAPRAPFAYSPSSMPFRVIATLGCSAMGSPTDEDLTTWHERTDRQLELCEWSDVAEELWTGSVAQDKGWDNRYLASPSAIDVGAGEALSVVNGIAGLEDYLGVCTCGQVHVIHVPQRAVPYLADRYQVIREGSRLFTMNGTLVVADRGYPGTGPNAEAPTGNDVWFYGTSVLSARMGPVEHRQTRLKEAYDPKVNNMQVRSERDAAISWICCHFTAHIDLCAK